MKKYLSLFAITVLSSTVTPVIGNQISSSANHLKSDFDFKKMKGGDSSITTTTTDNQGNIYGADVYGNVYVATKDSDTFTKKLTGLPSEPIQLLIDNEGNVYAGINFSYGLWRCDKNETQFKLVKGSKGYSIFASAVDQENNVYFPGLIDNWIKTTDKDTIFKYEAKTNKVIETKVEFPGVPSPYTYSSISAFTTDSQGNVYALDMFGRFYNYQSSINTFKLIKDFNLINTVIQSMTTDNSGNVYFQSINGVYKIDIKTKALIKLDFSPPQTEYMHFLRKDKDANIYVIDDESIFKFNFSNNKFEIYYTLPQPPKKILQLWDANFNIQGNIYITITSKGVYKS